VAGTATLLAACLLLLARRLGVDQCRRSATRHRRSIVPVQHLTVADTRTIVDGSSLDVLARIAQRYPSGQRGHSCGTGAFTLSTGARRCASSKVPPGSCTRPFQLAGETYPIGPVGFERGNAYHRCSAVRWFSAVNASGALVGSTASGRPHASAAPT
jgi:hypothetical protein